MPTLIPLLLLLAGFAVAAAGGDLFVRGAVAAARVARIPAAVIGVTVAAFATSSPELSVSVNSALAGTPQIALGDAIGSNVVNIALILGLALVLSPLAASRDSVRRDYPVALATPVVTAVLAWDGLLSRTDGLILLALFLSWLAVVVRAARRARSLQPAASGGRLTAALMCLGGLALLVVAGRLVVEGAKGMGLVLGLDPFVVGATMVAVGTSTPELATTLIAQLRGHSEISLGNVVGSNVFNAFLIVAVASLIRPIPVAWPDVSVGLTFGFVTMAMAFPPRSGLLGRKRGALLLLAYVTYVATILM